MSSRQSNTTRRVVEGLPEKISETANKEISHARLTLALSGVNHWFEMTDCVRSASTSLPVFILFYVIYCLSIYHSIVVSELAMLRMSVVYCIPRSSASFFLYLGST